MEESEEWVDDAEADLHPALAEAILESSVVSHLRAPP